MATYNYIAVIIIILIITACKSDKEQNPIVPVSIGKIQGVIIEAGTDFPLYNVMITTSPKTKETHSDSSGYFFLDNITPGDYIIYAHKPGYDYDSIFITVQADLTSEAEIRLINFSEYLDYYPLDIGNYWEYYQGSTPLYSIEIVSDTTVNNQHYFVSVFKSLPGGSYIEIGFERIDSNSALVYRYFPYYEMEMIIDSLPAKAGQKFRSNMLNDPYRTFYSYCYGIEDENILGEMRLTRSLIINFYPRYKIVKGIGLYQFEFHRVGAYTCKYARINGIEYGEKP